MQYTRAALQQQTLCLCPNQRLHGRCGLALFAADLRRHVAELAHALDEGRGCADAGAAQHNVSAQLGAQRVDDPNLAVSHGPADEHDELPGLRQRLACH